MGETEVTLLQVGEGRFLRAFLGVLLHRLKGAGWAGRAVLTAPRPSGGHTLAELQRRSGCYRVVVRDPAGEAARVLCPYDRIVDAFAAPEAWEQEVLRPTPLVIISNTTEAGLAYRLDPGPTPSTYPARLTEWLRLRRNSGLRQPVCVIPCELVDGNGRVLQQAVRRHALDRGLDPDALLTGVSFVETLVDRIVTADDPADPLACFAEPFMAWYLGGAPDWVRRALPFPGDAVHWVEDVTPARERKLRLLNATHTLLALTGLQLGLATVRQALEDPDLGAFARAALLQEAVGSFPPEARAEARTFAEQTLQRFLNPGLEHQLERIAVQTTAKIRQRWVPILYGYRQLQGDWPPRYALGIAAYLQLWADEGFDAATIDHPAWVAQVRAAWRTGADARQAIAALATAPDWPVPSEPSLLELVAQRWGELSAAAGAGGAMGTGRPSLPHPPRPGNGPQEASPVAVRLRALLRDLTASGS